MARKSLLKWKKTFDTDEWKIYKLDLGNSTKYAKIDRDNRGGYTVTVGEKDKFNFKKAYCYKLAEAKLKALSFLAEF